MCVPPITSKYGRSTARTQGANPNLDLWLAQAADWAGDDQRAGSKRADPGGGLAGRQQNSLAHGVADGWNVPAVGNSAIGNRGTGGVGKNSVTGGHLAELAGMGGWVVMVTAKMGACGTPSA